MKRNMYIRPEVEIVPILDKDILEVGIWGGSTGTGNGDNDFGGFAKEYGEDYNDFMSSYERGKEIDPLSED